MSTTQARWHSHNGDVISSETTVYLFAGVGETDCEAITSGFLAQPVNALSSVAYVVAGLWLVRRRAGARAARTFTRVLLGWALVGVGAGSFAFHGPMPSGARLFHDLTIATVLVVILTAGVSRLRRWSERTTIGALVSTIAVIGAIMALWPAAGLTLLVLTATAAVGVEISNYRTGLRGSRPPHGNYSLAAALALFAVAGLVQLLGRTGGPLCDPGSVYQGHAIWHVLTAIALALYGSVALPARQPGKSV